MTEGFTNAVENMRLCENNLLEAINRVFEEYAKMDYFNDCYLNMTEAIDDIILNFNNLIDKINNFNFSYEKVLTKNFSVGKICYILIAELKVSDETGMVFIKNYEVSKINFDGSESIVISGE